VINIHHNFTNFLFHLQDSFGLGTINWQNLFKWLHVAEEAFRFTCTVYLINSWYYFNTADMKPSFKTQVIIFGQRIDEKLKC